MASLHAIIVTLSIDILLVHHGDKAVILLVRRSPDYSRTAGLVKQESVPAPSEAEKFSGVVRRGLHTAANRNNARR